MPRAGWLIVVIALASGGAVAAVPRPPARAVVRAATEFIPADDPFPIRRVRASGGLAPDLLKELEPGPVVRLPRAEFESRVRAAGRTAAFSKQAARVVDATYFAELDGGELTGTAELGILNPHGAAGFAPLDPLRLAVRSAKWADGAEAVLATPGGATSPAVWVERDGRRVLQLDWSLAGTAEPGERRFELRVPNCPTSTLELKLPADQAPTASTEVLLTGPFEVPGEPARRLWRLRFGGGPRVEFAVRAAGAPAGVARAKLAAQYDLAPGQLAATFSYELRPARGPVSEWAFAVDAGLRIIDVATNNRAGWSVDPPAAGGSRRLRVNLRQPAPGGKVVISAVAPFPDATRPGDPLPVIRPLDVVLDDEKLELRVASSLKVEAWNPGDYRLAEASAVALPLGAADAFRSLSLTGTLLSPGADVPFRRMPSIRVAAAGAEFGTFERLTWALDADRSSLVARVDVRVRRGVLFQLAVRPPAGFVLDRAATGAEEAVSHIGAPAAGTQVVEFARPLPAGEHAELRLEFRGSGVKPGAAVPFPAFVVVGAAERDGWLSVSAPPHWSVAARAGAGATPGGLWGWLTAGAPADARAVYLFRGKEPEGSTTLTPATPTLAADTLMELDLPGDRWSATTRFTLAVTGGTLPTLAVVTPREAEPRAWKLLDERNAIQEAVPVPGELFALAPGLADFAQGHTVWLIRFARPLSGAAVLETTAPGPGLGEASGLLVPRVVGANQTTRAEAAPAMKDRAAVALNGDIVIPVLRNASQSLPVSDAYLVTMVRSPDNALAAFGGTVRSPSFGGTVRVFLPPEVEVRGACVGGRWLSPAACAARGPDAALVIPIPAGPAVRFEVRYRLPVETGWPARRVNSPVPGTGEGSVAAVKRWWAFAPGTLPASLGSWGASGEAPPLLGGPLSGEAEGLVTWEAEAPHVSVGAVRTADALAAALAALLVVTGLVALRRRRTRGAVVLGAAAVVALLAAEFAPPWWARVAWPPLVAATAALAAVLVALVARRGAAAPTLAVAAVSLLLFLSTALAAVAQPSPPAPATVLIVADGEGREEVVASRALVERLAVLARPKTPEPVVTSAEYDLRADEGGARVIAKLAVHAFGSGDGVLSLPLPDARLERVAVNGKAAFPTAPRPDVVSIALPGPGRHEVELRFAATVTAIGPEREVRFGVPESPRAKLVASLPGAARQPQAVGRVGRQLDSTGGERATLEAELGAVKSVQLRWREGAGGAAVLKVREGCVWEVAESGAELTAAYLVRVEQGSVAGLRFDVPAELEVLRVAARSTDAPAAPVPLRDWSLAAPKGGARLLRVDFQNPTAGRLLVVLECAPLKPITRQPVLRFPRVNFTGVTGEAESVYGLRASGVSFDGVGLGGVIDFPPDALKDFAAVPDLGLAPDNPVRAFRPVAGARPELRPTLRVGESASARTVTSWHVGPHRADASGRLAWSAKEPLPLVEFGLPGVRVLEVRGADVAAWNQSGGRVQVWLRGGLREGVIEWSGTAAPAPTGKPPPNPLPFDPAHPRMLNARGASDELRVRAIDGWEVKADRVRGWQVAAPAPGELRFRAEAPVAPELRIQLSPLKAPRRGEPPGKQ